MLSDLNEKKKDERCGDLPYKLRKNVRPVKKTCGLGLRDCAVKDNSLSSSLAEKVAVMFEPCDINRSHGSRT